MSFFLWFPRGPCVPLPPTDTTIPLWSCFCNNRRKCKLNFMLKRCHNCSVPTARRKHNLSCDSTHFGESRFCSEPENCPRGASAKWTADVNVIVDAGSVAAWNYRPYVSVNNVYEPVCVCALQHVHRRMYFLYMTCFGCGKNVIIRWAGVIMMNTVAWPSTECWVFSSIRMDSQVFELKKQGHLVTTLSTANAFISWHKPPKS